ncbi:cytosol aminopeptidase family, catalytic domain protein [Bacteriovorax sp. BSW11_IV]|uniref:leucyl aminopeptidase n=1 Tax=Bacteriovorax sp. BSW11_IV TaxID=1353529 RepID=UPI000389DBE0|nr:leucyl aminopeptidase [Bacteriovorax sp. BSW11_IV]EQC45920.1 cytosol aminopeptidase family, catalytic domain protein [Bacteriovorax sp. BSW11_IV]
MELKLNLGAKESSGKELVIVSAFQKKTEAKGKKKEATTEVVSSHWAKEFKTSFDAQKSSKLFKAGKGENYFFALADGREVMVIGLGDKKDLELESLRKTFANIYKAINKKYTNVSVELDGFVKGSHNAETLQAIAESLYLTSYSFDKYLSAKTKTALEVVTFDSAEKKTAAKKLEAALNEAKTVTAAINYARDLVNEPPNVLRSTEYSKRIKADVAKLKGVKCKVLGKKELEKEKMGLFLSVNSGSGFEPQLVHLTYTPAKATKNTKHIALVGKGLVFDTGGYSLKPGGSMMNMKFDMAGSATVYAAFRAAAELGLNVKITCILGITDNAVNSFATMPDSIVHGRNGKSVEILNTDAEGRLVLADCLDYACDQNPDAIIDAATLTGAVLVALGSEICGLMGNDDKLQDKLIASAKATDEYMWKLPVIKEFGDDIKSNCADLRNIGKSSFGGSAKAASFLGEFVKNDIPWAHLDIAGIGDSQGHLPYCPAKGASGLIVRTLVDFLKNS